MMRPSLELVINPIQFMKNFILISLDAQDATNH